MRIGLPQARPNRAIHDTDTNRLNEQFVVKGVDPVLSDLNSVYFLEYVYATTAVNLKDYNGNTVATLPANVWIDLGNSPIRMDGGFTLNGTISIGKGFIMTGLKADAIVSAP